ncbi:transposase, partial [Methylobacterium sp. WL64]|uniref:transposase n=1 Tax=Methylobacterium sp. WL64 TaxID=2603894 RepID=UPI0011CA5ABC
RTRPRRREERRDLIPEIIGEKQSGHAKPTLKTKLGAVLLGVLSAHAIERRHKYGTAPERPPQEVTISCETFAPTIQHYTFPTKLCCSDRSPVKASSDTIRVQDCSRFAAPTFLVIKKQRFECRVCKKRFYEVLPDVNDTPGVKQRGRKRTGDDTGIKHIITKRLRRSIAIAAVEHTAAKAADLLHVDVGLVERVFADYRDTMTENHEYRLPRKLGIDGTHILGKARCVIADVKNNKILEILPHDNPAEIYKHFSEKFERHEREEVEFFVHDMAEMYNPIRTLFPNSTQIIDRFHVVKLIQKYTDVARNSITSDMDEGSQKKMRRNVRLFKGPRYNLRPGDKIEHDRLVKANDRLYHVTQARKLFEEIFQEKTKAEALWRYELWVGYIHKAREYINLKKGAPDTYSLVPWFGPLFNTMEDWKGPIFAGFDDRYTTAFVESMNRRVKEINRDASGLSFAALRAKALLKYGEYHTKSDLVSFNLTLFPIGIKPETYSLGHEEFEVFETLLKQCHLRGHKRIKDLRRLIYAVLWRTMNGGSWHDLRSYPEYFGNPSTAARVFYRWAKIGVWERLALAADEWRERIDLPPLQHSPKLQIRNIWFYDDHPATLEAIEYILMLPGLLIMIAEREQELMAEGRVWRGFTPDDLYSATR